MAHCVRRSRVGRTAHLLHVDLQRRRGGILAVKTIETVKTVGDSDS
jgi:hypothetical protein